MITIPSSLFKVSVTYHRKWIILIRSILTTFFFLNPLCVMLQEGCLVTCSSTSASTTEALLTGCIFFLS